MHPSQTLKTTLWAIALILLLPGTVQAQGFGVRGGVTLGPAFAFGGARLATSGRRPFGLFVELDLAGGPHAATIFTFGFESPLIHRSTLSWAPYFGGGATLFFANKRGFGSRVDDLGDGYCVLFGLENRRRVSVEIQVYAGENMPRVFLAVGYRFH